MDSRAIFDEWPERYDQWFTTPIGKLVKEIEGELIRDLLDPMQGESILDAGCGTGIFTLDFLVAKGNVVGPDISGPMLNFSRFKTTDYDFVAVQADMEHLPFKDNYFEKSVSVTAPEFIANAKSAVSELFRVTRPGGRVVVATLNSLSPWVVRRKAKTESGKSHILRGAFFRSPSELLACSPYIGEVKAAIHFQKDGEPGKAMKIEQLGRLQGIGTGAFVAVRWQKPILAYSTGKNVENK